MTFQVCRCRRSTVLSTVTGLDLASDETLPIKRLTRAKLRGAQFARSHWYGSRVTEFDRPADILRNMAALPKDFRIGLDRGKWSQEGVPHKGWECVEIEDLGSQDATCEMCESQQIRYAHHMEHPDYPETLIVGCVCAGHMEQDLVGAKRRDKKMRARARTRTNWLKRKWKVSQKGNPWISANGYRVVIRRKQNRWTATIAATDDSYVHHLRRTFQTSDHAKLAAFDLVTSLLSKS